MAFSDNFFDRVKRKTNVDKDTILFLFMIMEYMIRKYINIFLIMLFSLIIMKRTC